MGWISTKGEQFFDKHTEVGDSIGHVKTLQEEFDNFENKAKVTGGGGIHIKREHSLIFKCTLKG